jgi:hypothetical protein
VRDRMLEAGFIRRDELERDMAALDRHLSRDDVHVISNMFFG